MLKRGMEFDTLIGRARMVPLRPQGRLSAAHGSLHTRVFCHYYFNTHPYYHREGYWLTPDARLKDAMFHCPGRRIV
jgi:hypothetical protein